MAFNVATFRKRALTAAMFTIVMLVGLLWNQWSFIILFSIIHFGCWYEFFLLIKKIYPAKYGYYLPAGILYITFPMLMMIDLSHPDLRHNLANNNFLPVLSCGIIFSVWINDTAAYLVGSLVGKTPFSIISPKKTWEGTIGGALLCVLLTGYVVAPVLATLTATNFLQAVHWFSIGALCAIFGTIGDLLESKLKRMAAVKDSGSFMPGHGGFLDRFDSILGATPFVWLYVYFFKHYL